MDAEQNLVRGIEFAQQGDWDAAITCYQHAIQLDPEMAEAYNNLGNLFKDQGRYAESIAALRKAVQLRPSLADVHFNLGCAYQTAGQLLAAEACYRTAIELVPTHAGFHIHLGNALLEQGRLPSAEAAYRHSLVLSPDRVEALYNLGNALRAQGRFAEAQALYLRAIERQPQFADAYFNLGNTFRDQGDHLSAAAAFRHAVALRPGLGEASLVYQLQMLCQWDEIDELSKRVVQAIEAETTHELAELITPFSFLCLPIPTTPAQQYRCALKWSYHRFRPTPAIRSPHRSPFQFGRKLKIGYLSSDFRTHPVGYLMPELIEAHDRNRFEIHGYGFGPSEASPIRQRLLAGFDRFRELNALTSPQSAEAIAADKIDILIDLNGYTQHARPEILSFRPAPIQVNYLGYPGTMGADFIDYILVDDFVVPAEQQPYFTERLVHLPGCYMVNDSRRAIAEHIPSRSECGLPESAFVLCAFNASYKITSTMFDAWCRLLRSIPNSVLWLRDTFRPTVDNLRRAAWARGISDERLIFAPQVEMPVHLARHAIADLFLDTFPYNQHSTASDALRMGLPIVTLCGASFPSRVGGSLLRALDLTELIAMSLDEYESIAIHLAKHRDALAAIRQRLALTLERCELFDGRIFARHVESAYLAMWENYQRGASPQPIQIASATRGTDAGAGDSGNRPPS